MRRWVFVGLIGCYHPSAQPGLPCSADGSCPDDQRCDQTTSPPTCLETLGDAAVPDPDGDPDGPPQGCAAGCPSTAPFCDQSTQTCRGCIADTECSSDACHELTGECIPQGHVLYVAPGGTGTTCMRSAPCGSIDNADNQRTGQRDFIKIADGRYTDRFQIRPQPGATTVVISGPDRTWAGPELVATGGANKVEQNMTAVIEGVSILDSTQEGIDSLGSVTVSHVLFRNNDVGVRGRGPMTRILDSQIEASRSTGVLIATGVGEIERTVMMTNVGGGLRIETAVGYSVINTIIANNGNGSSGQAGVRILGTAPLAGPAVFRFNTVANNQAPLAATSGFECGRPVVIESSIMANPPGLFQTEMTPMCTAQTSLFAQGAPAAGGNLMGAPMFVSTTDCHVLPASPAVNAAPIAGAPALDVDGETRSGADAPDIGADELP